MPDNGQIIVILPDGIPTSIRHEVVRFSRLMEARLREKDGQWPEGWNAKGVSEMLNRVQEVLWALDDAYLEGDTIKAMSKATDLANYAMMIADNIGGLE